MAPLRTAEPAASSTGAGDLPFGALTSTVFAWGLGDTDPISRA
jgi:hypothetical protein